MESLSPRELRRCLSMHSAKLDWHAAVTRRVSIDEARGPGSWGFSRCIASERRWDDLLAAFHARPDATWLGVRLAATQIGQPERAAIDSAVRAHQAASAVRDHEAAAGLGVSIRQPVSPCSADAAMAMHHVASRLAEPVLVQFDAVNQNLGFMDVGLPDSVGLPAAALRVPQTLDRAEATSLLYLPRFDERPTPGLELDVPRAAPGIPGGPFIFVSYSRADLSLTAAIVDALTEWRVATWWDLRLVIGDDLCHPRRVGVVVVLTEQTYLSEWVTQEVAVARVRGRNVVEVRLRPTGSLAGGPRLSHDLIGWTGDMSDARLEKLRRDLVDIAGWQP